jgi:FMN phosphatase YigB (HAD superfamily)
MPDVTHIFFDYGGLLARCAVTPGTLRRGHRKAAAYLAAYGFPVTVEQIERAREPVLQDYRAARRHHREWPLNYIVERTLQELRLPVSGRTLERHAMAIAGLYERSDHDYRMFPDLKEVIPALAKHATLGIISNCPHSSAEHELEKEGLLRHFSYRTYSGELGFRKPLASVFEYVLLYAGVDNPRQAVYVSHERKDLLGARGAGMTGVLIRRDKGETLHRLLRYI